MMILTDSNGNGMIDESPHIALISAISTFLGVVGTLVYSYFKGRAGFRQQIREELELILEEKNLTIERKSEALKDREEKIGQLEAEIERLKKQ